MTAVRAVIFLRPGAPDKPAFGTPCNGCGVCCATAPCPLGAVVSRRTRGPCEALKWVEESNMYRCGLIAKPQEFLPRALVWAAPLVAKVARRYIAAGQGCDSDLQAQRER